MSRGGHYYKHMVMTVLEHLLYFILCPNTYFYNVLIQADELTASTMSIV